MLRRSSSGALLLVLTVGVVACGSSNTDIRGSSRDAGAGGSAASSGGAGSGAGGVAGAAGAAGNSGAGGRLSPLMARCGDAICSPIDQAGVESSACCTESGGCGYRIPIATKCLSVNMPGHTTPACVPYQAGQLMLAGCCTPTGCGARLTLADIGCIPNPDLGRDPVNCVFDSIGAGGAAGDASPAAP